MIVRTPQAEARVLGTAFQMTVEAGVTRLAVKSGKVRLTRRSDGRSVDVPAGAFAVAGPGADLSPRPLAPKVRPPLLAEAFEEPRGVDARWRPTGGALRTSGRLEIDLVPAAPDGWTGGGLQTRQAFPSTMAVAVDVDVPLLHPGVVTAVVFVPPGRKRGSEGVFRVQLRENRYGIWTEAVEPRERAGAERPGVAPCRERWRIEIQGASVKLLVQDREVLKHVFDVPPAAALHVELDASARGDAPPGARAAFDNVAIEPFR
jgi:hypothetical protein